MTPVNRLLICVALILSACAQEVDTTTTSSPSASVGSSTATPTTLAEQPMEIQGCATPPVTFSALCEVYELVQEWHVDRPIPDATLADVALDALRAHIPLETEERPRTLFCSVPSEVFAEFCAELATMVWESQIAVGPAVDEAVVAMTGFGLDPFTYYIPPDQVGSFRQNGLVGGVGVLLDASNSVGSKCARIDDSCPLEIVVVLEGNPGSEAGLQAGDRILSVDGEPVEGKGFAATATAIAGDETGTVELTIERADEIVEFSIQRAPLSVPTVDASIPMPGVGYLRIPDFEADIAALVEDALISLSEASPGTLVIDLRDNPGGFVDTVIEVADQFIDEGIIVETRDPDGETGYQSSTGGLATAERLIVLVNRGTASAAEILAGALRDQRAALLLGTNTFGKDAVQIPFELRNGGELYVAVARWYTPLGLTAGNGGLTPDRELQVPSGVPVEELVQAALDAAS